MRVAVAVPLSVALALGGIAEPQPKAARADRTPTMGVESTAKAHGGSYSGSQGSSHKGGNYKNPSTGNQYGKHKQTSREPRKLITVLVSDVAAAGRLPRYLEEGARDCRA